MADLIYNKFKKSVLDGSIVLTTGTVKAMLVTSSYVPNADHPFVDSGTGSANPKTNEVSDASYSRKTLGSKTATQDDTNDVGYFDAADLTWAALTGVVADALILFLDLGGADTANPLIAYIDSGGFPVTPGGADLVVQWAATGIIDVA